MDLKEKATILKDAKWIQRPMMDPVSKPAFKDPSTNKMHTIDAAMAIHNSRKVLASMKSKDKTKTSVEGKDEKGSAKSK